MTIIDDRPITITAVHRMHTLNHEGDSKFDWNPRNRVEVEAARAHFLKLRGDGHLLYRAGEGGAQNEQLHEFDPNAERIIAVPPMQGG